MIPVITLGEALIDFIPVNPGDTLAEAPAFSRQAGGAPANVAVQVARLGGKARFIGKVGADAFGYFLEKTLKKEGVDTSCLLKTEEARTALAFVSRVEEDENPFTFYRDPAADQLLKPEEVNPKALGARAIFHFGSVSLSSEPSGSATRQAVKIAREKGALISFDPNIRPPLWTSMKVAREEIQSLLPQAHLVKISRSELFALTDQNGRNPEVLAKQLRETHDIPLLIVSLGATGCLYVSAHGSGTIPAPRVEVVDPTGAGDSLTGSLLYRISREDLSPNEFMRNLTDAAWLEDQLRFAVTVASHSITRQGAIASYAGQADLESLGLSE
ncbi:fructokinase [Melghirimyces profundicolus]|uniref:Fructokinase n=1 Tax=Melghirimyces profundicolus TaxID=1242148 RepID=A0A2T6AZA1_9BACL|nr:carbohydrate kinase [Melghirimyces profundicolus]PTX49145.1 fructokinase [Melghirimyces profundicolus]